MSIITQKTTDPYARLNRTIVLEDPTLEWNFKFDMLKMSIVNSCAVGNICLEVEHVGSTSLGSIKSKPVIDIAIGCNQEDIESLITCIEDLGFVYLPEFKQRFPSRLFFYLGTETEHIAHIFLVAFGGTDWLEMLAMRDFLRSDPDAASEYERAKIKAVEAHGDNISLYSRSKAPVYERLLKKALSRVQM